MSEKSTDKRITDALKKSKVAKLFKLASKYGVMVPGWSCIDYMRDAVKNMGWESTCVSGQKGSAKSNLVLQHGKAIYGSTEKADKYLVTERPQLFDLMQEALDTDRRLAWVGVDDIAALFPKSLYFTHRKLYSKMQSSWETVRTVMNNFEFSCTLKNKVASFILADITGDIICYNRQGEVKSHYDYQRWLWLRSLKDPTRMIPKLIRIEDIPFPLIPEAFGLDASLKGGIYYSGGKEYRGEVFFKKHACLTGIERTDFQKYWNRRLALTKESFKEFTSIFEERALKQAKLTEAQVQSADNGPTPQSFSRRGVVARRRYKEENERLRQKLEELKRVDRD